MTSKEALKVIELNAGRLSHSMQEAIKTLVDERIALTEYVRDRMKAVIAARDDNESFGFDNTANDALLAELGDLIEKMTL